MIELNLEEFDKTKDYVLVLKGARWLDFAPTSLEDLTSRLIKYFDNPPLLIDEDIHLELLEKFVADKFNKFLVDKEEFEAFQAFKKLNQTSTELFTGSDTLS